MGVVASAKVKNEVKKDRMWVNIAIMLVLMVGFGFLEPFGGLTPVGMKLTGVFLGMLWGWSTCGLLWTSLMGVVALGLTEVMTVKEFLTLSFGNETVVFILFIFIFTGVIDQVGLIDYIANLFISFKILNHRPWVFSTLLLLAAFISSAFVNMFAAIIVFWEIIYIVSKRFGFKPYDRYPSLMLIGVILASSIGGVVMPYKPVSLVILNTYAQISGIPLDYFKYICFSLPTTLAVMLIYVVVCKVFFRPDLKELNKISVEFADKDKLILNVKQKVALGFLVTFIFLMIAPSILPATWWLTEAIKQIGIVGCLFTLLICMCWVKFDGEPMLDFPKIARHVNWDVYVIMAFIIPFASIYTSDVTGLKPFMVGLLQPILGGQSPIVFILLTLVLATIITNFANNMVVGAIFTTLVYTIGGDMGMDVMPIVVVLIVCVNLALCTPAASPVAAIMFANSKWLRVTDLYKITSMLIILILAFVMIFGIAWANIVY